MSLGLCICAMCGRNTMQFGPISGGMQLDFFANLEKVSQICNSLYIVSPGSRAVMEARW